MTIQEKIRLLRLELSHIESSCSIYSKLSDNNACKDNKGYFEVIRELKQLEELNNNDLN